MESEYLGRDLLECGKGGSRFYGMAKPFENDFDSAQNSEQIKMIDVAHMPNAENLSLHITLTARNLHSEFLFELDRDRFHLILRTSYRGQRVGRSLRE